MQYYMYVISMFLPRCLMFSQGSCEFYTATHKDTVATNVEQRHCELQTVHHDVLQVVSVPDSYRDYAPGMSVSFNPTGL